MDPIAEISLYENMETEKWKMETAPPLEYRFFSLTTHSRSLLNAPHLVVSAKVLIVQNEVRSQTVLPGGVYGFQAVEAHRRSCSFLSHISAVVVCPEDHRRYRRNGH
jgi:hypothetical protein